MMFAILFLFSFTTNFLDFNHCASFDLILNVDDLNHYFRFVEKTNSTSNKQLPSTIILDSDNESSILNSSSLFSVQTYQVESDETTLGFATVIDREPTDSKLVFAMVQTFDGSIYDISSPMSISQTRNKRSVNKNYIVRNENSIVEQASVIIEWNNDRERREIDDTENTMESLPEKETRLPASETVPSTTHLSVSMPDTIENITRPSAENDTELIINATIAPTTPRPIPAKTRHLYLEIVALIDSLTTHDLRMLLNKTELETIEILKLYYIHIFMGVEQIYRQSLIHETLDVHIRLSKLIFATDKHRLPWESFKNISSIANPYRKTPNNMHLRPNISMNLLKSLHQVYTSNQFDKKYFNNYADHIMTFTRLNLIDGAGFAYVLGTCLPQYKYSLIQEDLNAYSLMITVAHELGHNLGLDHDETENECNDPRFRYIMSPKNMNSADRRQLSYFSECSIRQLNDFADNTTTTCWKNQITSMKNDTKFDRIREIISFKLGQIINVHQQCQLQYGPEAIPYVFVMYNSKNHSFYEENLCNQLKCFKKPQDNYMFWQGGAFEGTPCAENHVCQKNQCVPTNKTEPMECPYGDLLVPIPMLNIMNTYTEGNMLCSDALNLLRSHGMNVTHLCYDSTMPYRQRCCEECKKHSIPECGDQNTICSMFRKYCDMPYMSVNGVPVMKLCPYTCGQCPDLPPPPPPTTTTTTALPIIIEEEVELTTITKRTTTKKIEKTTPKPRKYVKLKTFTKYTCIDSADCSQLVKTYSRLKKNVKNWCTEHSTMVNGHYFAERCPKYCSLCNITSECDEYQLCRNNGTCIKDEHGTYQCLCSKTKFYYGTLCEYRRTCLDEPCANKTDYCLQTHGENYVCLSKKEQEQIRMILNGKK